MIKSYNKGLGTYLSKNFKIREFDCKCSRCSKTLVDEELVTTLQKIRDHFGVAVNITSGYRCAAHNAEVGGASQSYHMQGKAADIYANSVKPIEIAQYAESIGVRGIGQYSNFVHIDTRPNKYYWTELGSHKAVSTFGTDTLKPDKNDAKLIGRLVIPSCSIDVGLYGSNSQIVCDAEDSACYYMNGEFSHVIADHNNQSFKNLPLVKVGTKASLNLDSGTINIECVQVLDGHNTGNDLTDNSGKTVKDKADYIMYTCKDKWENIKICLFNVVNTTKEEQLAKEIIDAITPIILNILKQK